MRILNPSVHAKTTGGGEGVHGIPGEDNSWRSFFVNYDIRHRRVHRPRFYVEYFDIVNRNTIFIININTTTTNRVSNKHLAFFLRKHFFKILNWRVVRQLQREFSLAQIVRDDNSYDVFIEHEIQHRFVTFLFNSLRQRTTDKVNIT